MVAGDRRRRSPLGFRRHPAGDAGAGRVAGPGLAAAQMILDGLPERVGARPGEAANECFVDVGEPGVREVVAQVVEVGPGPLGAHGLSGRRGVGKGLVADCYPQPVEHPPVPGVFVEPGGVALVAEDGDLVEQGVELQQRVPVGADVAAHSGVAVTRSGLTCSLASAPSEYSATSAPSSWVASRWNSNMSNRSRPSPTWPRSRPGEAKARRLMPCRAASSTSSAARARTCCSVAGGRCSGSARGWLTPPAYRPPSGAGISSAAGRCWP